MRENHLETPYPVCNMARLTAEESTTCILMDQLGYNQVIAERIGLSQKAVSLSIRRHQAYILL